MKSFEIDVSGPDIFSKDYTILVAEASNEKIMLGHRFEDKARAIIRSRFGEGGYKYRHSKKGGVYLKIRLYCVTIYYIFKELKRRHRLKEIHLDICRDFSGNEAEIKNQLNHLLGKKLGLEVKISFLKLPKGSIADKYAFILRHDKLNKLAKLFLPIKVAQLEAFLKD